MGRRGRVKCKSRVRAGGDSDDSDEDYLIEEEEEVEASDGLDAYCSDASAESHGGFMVLSEGDDDDGGGGDDDDDDDDEEEVREMPRSKARRGSLGQKKIGVKLSRKRKRISYEEEDLDEENDWCGDEDDDDEEFTPDEIDSVDEEDDLLINNKIERIRKKVGGGKTYTKKGLSKGKRRKKFFDSDDDDDEEFTPDEIDSVDEEDDLLINNRSERTRKKVGGKKTYTKKGSSKGGRMKKFGVVKKNLKKKGKNSRGVGRKTSRSSDVERNRPTLRTKSKKVASHGRRKRFVGKSDSDFMSSESSDHEYTISEEERDQVREAGDFCRRLKRLRSSSALKRTQDVQGLSDQEKLPARKGKEKVEDPSCGVVKQVCGICLSEEGKRTVRGILNCCSHFFCFACILEWSKVESRCPLCKQRFVTISKPAKSNAGTDLRNAVFQIPEKDQVYQPSEEELRIYLDPYEHVICIECQQGGDDGLMLLCDLCDSPAHTYCVGLGREVPEGNWYCGGCRPAALGSPNFGALLPYGAQRTANNDLFRGSLDINYSPLPQLPHTQGFGIQNNSLFNAGNAQNASPFSGIGPSTLSRRRRVHRQIHQLISTQLMARMPGRTATRDLLNAQVHDAREPSVQQERTPEIGTPPHNFFEERVPHSPFSLHPNRDSLAGSLGLNRRQMLADSATTPTDHSGHSALRGEYEGGDLISSSQQLNQYSSRPNMAFPGGLSPCTVIEGGQVSASKEQLQTLVGNYLQSFSRDIDMGCSTFENIARKSTEAILVACGLEQMSVDVYTVQPPDVCSHIEMVSGGQISLMKGCCSSCFESFVGNTVMGVMKMHLPTEERLGSYGDPGS